MTDPATIPIGHFHAIGNGSFRLTCNGNQTTIRVRAGQFVALTFERQEDGDQETGAEGLELVSK